MKQSVLSKALCTTLAFLLLLQALPLSVFANDYGSSNNIEPDGILNITETESLEISCEIIDSRTEFSKVFLLSDDTFYNINTTYPLHKWENNAWADIYDGFNDVDTIDDVKEIVSEIDIISNSAVGTSSDTNSSSNSASIETLINSDICWSTEYEAYEINASDGALRITPNTIMPYTAKNRAITSARLTFSRADIDEPIESLITICEGVENVTLQNLEQLNIVDEFTATSIGEYSADITNLYAKWDINALPNYGVVLRSRSNNYFTIRNAFFEVFYEEIDWNDANYTYKTVDLGNGGVLSINNYTNTALFENRLFKLDSSVLPVYLSRINDSANPNITSSAGFGFTWNIESTISISNNLGTWNTIDLEKKRFVPDETVIIESGYQIWKENDSNRFEDQTSIYFYVPNDDIINNTIDYSEVYIKQGDTKYSFDSNGRLILVERPGVNNKLLSVEIIYDSEGNLDKVITEKAVEYDFEYSYNSEMRKKYLWRIWVNGSYYMLFGIHKSGANSFDPVDSYLYNIYWYKENDEVVDDSVVYFYTDKMGNVVDFHATENIWKFEYCNTGDRAKGLGNRMESYTILPLNEGTNSYSPRTTVDFEMPNGNYREIVTENLLTHEKETEIIQYDRNHRVITHKEPNGYCICVDYDENGIVNSFAFNENAANLMLNSSFEIGSESPEYNWTSSDYAEVVPSTYKNGEHGENELKLNLTEMSNVSVSQTINGSFSADNTYVVGAWVKVEQTIPNEDKKIGIQVNDVTNGSATEVTFGTIDNGLDNEWQYRLQAFKPSSNTSKLQINLTALNQIGEIRFDEITLFKASESQVDLMGIDTSSSIEYSYDENNRLSSEIITNGVHSIVESYEYNDDGSIRKVNNINGNDKYYEETSLEDSSYSKTIGTTVDSEGNILDATSFEYDALNLLSKVSQTVNGLSGVSSSTATMTTEYGWQGDDISSVTHNGVTYSFEYEPDGFVEITASSNNISQKLVEKDFIFEEEDLDYSIVYANDYAIEYLHNEETGLIEYIDYYCPAGAFSPEYSYLYTYDEDTEELMAISLIISDEEVYSVNYLENGYQSIDIFENELYIKGTNDNGEKVETINQAYFTGSNNTSSDTIVTSNTTISEPNSSNGSTTNSSSIIVNKNASDNKHSEMTYERNSVTDYFDRLSGKKTKLTYETGDKYNTVYNVESNTNYEYKMLDVGVSSGLVHKYDTTISGKKGTTSTEMREYVSYSRCYEYDDNGNIKYVYVQNGSTETPCEYYEYDEANQLVTAINFYNGSVVKYIYDIGGNATSKNIYNYSELVFDYGNRTITSLGDVSSTVSYAYDSVYKDRLVTYNGLNLNCDSLGNPRNYTGRDIDNSIITGNLEWNGYNLTAFDNDDMRIEYQYNQSGDRTMKTVYDKSDNRLVYRMSYIWDNGVLSTLIYQGGDSEEVNLNIIYDQEGAPVGYITSMGLPYYFLKDYNENVIGLVHADGTLMYSITYDTWGIPTYTYHGNNLLENIIIKATAVFNPVTFHGYIYDYETGMYCSRGRCYSPEWGRYLNSDVPTTLMNVTDYVLNSELISNDPMAILEAEDSVLDANLYLFCNNNPINSVDLCSMWSRECNISEKSKRAFRVPMSDLFASRALCTIFANQILEEHGEWSPDVGYNYQNMNSLRVASTLFAHYIAKNAPTSINKVNASWGDSWVMNCQQANIVEVNRADKNAWKYEKIWFAADKIKDYAWDEGIYITI